MVQAKKSKRIAVLYGSETGNAEDFASILSHKLHRHHFAHTLSTLGDYRASDILECRQLFIICSTTGQGELPRNALEASYGNNRKNTFWSFLRRKNLPSDLLNHVNVSFLGLGDSSYPKFNYAIRKLHERIVNQLGAKESYNRLEADEQCLTGSNKGTGAGIETVYFEFERRALQNLLQIYPTRKVNGEIIKREEMHPEAYLRPASFLVIDGEEGGKLEPASFHGDEFLIGTVKKNERITHADHFQDVRQFVFNGVETSSYEPGDTVSIFPSNSDELVESFLEVQPHWKTVADRPLKLSGDVPSIEGGLVQPLTLRNLLKYHCDINSVPRASFFIRVWTFATDVTRMERGDEQLKQQREKLRQFGSDEDMQDLFDYCNRPRRSLLEVLQDFLSLRLPWEFALDFLPPLKPRYFSISSGPNCADIELTVAIVKYKTILRKIRKGVCTDFIAGLSPGKEIRFKVQRNHLFDNQNLRGKPMILVSPGVGIAPMMSLIKSDISNQLMLFFGNRYMDMDFLYRDTLEGWEKENRISLFTCFSRDRENSLEYKYVQDRLWAMGNKLTKILIENEAMIYVCGSSGKMPTQVRITILEMLKKWGDFQNDDAATKYLKQLEKDGRYLQETW